MNNRIEVGLIIIVLILICAFSVSAISNEGAKISAPIERPKREKPKEDWRITLGVTAVVFLGLYVWGNRKVKKSHTSGRKEKKTKKKRGRWMNVPY